MWRGETITLSLVVESFLPIFFNTNWKLLSIVASVRSSLIASVKVGKAKQLSLMLENPLNCGMEFPRSSALRPELDG